VADGRPLIFEVVQRTVKFVVFLSQLSQARIDELEAPGLETNAFPSNWSYGVQRVPSGFAQGGF
jgi:hypothetical protein